jgi:hypothetical protein
MLPHDSSYMRMGPKFIAKASSLITCAISASNDGLIFLRVGQSSDATRWSQRDLCQRADLLTLIRIRDNVGARTLTSASYTDTTGMTVENCVNFCISKDTVYAGVEYAQECCESCFDVVHALSFFHISVILIPRFWIIDCGNVISNGATTASNSDCSFPCTGNANEICGAGNRLNLYWSGATPSSPPIIAPSDGLWESLGCYRYIHLPFWIESGSLTLLCLPH